LWKFIKKDALKTGKILLDQYHIIGIAHKDCLTKEWKKEYEGVVTWENFMRSKRKRRFFDDTFLEKLKELVWGLSFNMVYVDVYFRELSPLILEIPERNFLILLAPLNPDIREKCINDL